MFLFGFRGALILLTIDQRKQAKVGIVWRDHQLAVGVTGAKFDRETVCSLCRHEALRRQRADDQREQGKQYRSHGF